MLCYVFLLCFFNISVPDFFLLRLKTPEYVTKKYLYEISPKHQNVHQTSCLLKRPSEIKAFDNGNKFTALIIKKNSFKKKTAKLKSNLRS